MLDRMLSTIPAKSLADSVGDIPQPDDRRP
jgi:hypothetical protein